MRGQPPSELCDRDLLLGVATEDFLDDVSVNLLQATPAATSTGASGVVANNAVYVDCPILLFPEEPCIVYYIQNRGVSSVTFYTSSGATAKGSYNCKASYCDVSFVGTPIGDDNYATAWTIFGPAIRDAETTAG